MVEDAVETGEPSRRTGLGLGPIIAIVIIVILLGTGLFFLVWDPDVSEITVINPEDVDTNGDLTYDSVRFTLVTIKDGMRGIDENARIDVIHEGETTMTLEKRVKHDQMTIDLKYDQFVVGNGVYDIRASMDGTSGQAQYSVSFVATSVNLSLIQSEDPALGPSSSFVVTPLFQGVQDLGKGFRMSSYEDLYYLTVRITDPDGTIYEYSDSMGDLPGNYSERYELDSLIMGEYSAEVSLENRMVKSDETLRTVTGEGGAVSGFINSPPSITEAKVLTSRPRVNEEVEISIKATDLDQNGEITTVLVWWDMSDNQMDLEEITVSSRSASLKVSHVFDSATTYTVQVTVGDNGPEWGGISQTRYATQELMITVRLI